MKRFLYQRPDTSVHQGTKVNIALEKLTLQPRAPFFNHFFAVKTAKIIPRLLCLRRRHLSELMAYFGALTLSTPRSETAIYQISPAAFTHTHTRTPLYSTANFSCQSPSGIIIIFFFFFFACWWAR